MCAPPHPQGVRIVVAGVLIDTFIVRALLVPALTYDAGPAIWWPGRKDRPTAGPGSVADRAGKDDNIASVRPPGSIEAAAAGHQA